MIKYFIFLLLSSFIIGMDEEIIYATLIDTNYDHGLFDDKIFAIYKSTMRK